MILSLIIISNDAVKRCVRGELIFSLRDVVGRRPKHAGIAELKDKRGKFVAIAFVSPGSRYYLRIISRKKEKADRAFWRERILAAYKRRSRLEALTDAYRVVHAEADGIPSVVIDKYNDIWSLQISSAGAETIKNDLAEIIADEFGPASIIEKNDLAIRKFEGLSLAEKTIYGDRSGTFVREGSQRFKVDVLRGQKTGAYLDYRAFRLKAREFAMGFCLDAFCYEGWFSCQIAKSASNVVAVDSSEEAISAAKENARQNGHDNIEFIKSDVFKYLDRCERKFDFIHLDPPPFAKGHGRIESAIAGYKKLLSGALGLINDGGILFVSSCSHAVTENVLEKTVLDCMKRAGFKPEIVFRGIQDVDHPLLKGFPRSLYLKAIAAKVALSGPHFSQTVHCGGG